MFLHILKYELKVAMKNKQAIFWLFAFPAVLGTFFYIAFGNIYADSDFEKIPVALVAIKEDSTFEQTIDAVAEGDDGLFDVKRVSGKKAEQLLEDGDVSGIIYEDEELTLTVKSEGIKATIIRFFLDQYLANSKLISDMIRENPLNILRVSSFMNAELEPLINKEMSKGNQDPYVQYFYNLLAMSCLFSAFGGTEAASRTQANFSALGARRCVAPVSRFSTLTASMISQGLLSFVCNTLAMFYLRFVLGVKFGVPISMMLVIILVGSLMGLAVGYFVGTLCHKENLAIPIVVAVMMFFCFMSGLMIGNMRGIVEMKLPWFNHVNPAALIADSFYVLNIYGSNERFVSNILILLGMTMIFMSAGALLTGRKKYAAL
ncbi:MAG: ABC transporter permease [Ruminococcus sp.]|nr:ABC transporter permease [Ruminococcus sp.]